MNSPCFISSVAIPLKKGGLGQPFTLRQYPVSREGCFQDHSSSPVAAHVSYEKLYHSWPLPLDITWIASPLQGECCANICLGSKDKKTFLYIFSPDARFPGQFGLMEVSDWEDCLCLPVMMEAECPD